MAFMEYMRAGGAIMWIILGISVLSAALVIERLIFFAAASANLVKLKDSFGAAMSEGGTDAARSACAGYSSLRRLFSDALSNWHIDDEEMSTLLERRVDMELYRWEKNMSLLETAAKISPLLGLLGTVLGMVEMFRTLNMGGAINTAAVTGGIWKALFTTVAGLTVAIPVLVAHGFLSGWINAQEETLRRGADFLMRERATRKAA
ncbi:MAG: MotA/TolQ/ExbB proton channel family protein [Synergistaceae bacterium]|jgi:biopolymer transport protein ExbB|nr:MotA/TolQ/ExbB proton channel family protein [Synergistaceae bacterium]